MRIKVRHGCVRSVVGELFTMIAAGKPERVVQFDGRRVQREEYTAAASRAILGGGSRELPMVTGIYYFDTYFGTTITTVRPFSRSTISVRMGQPNVEHDDCDVLKYLVFDIAEDAAWNRGIEDSNDAVRFTLHWILAHAEGRIHFDKDVLPRWRDAVNRYVVTTHRIKDALRRAGVPYDEEIRQAISITLARRIVPMP